MCIPGAAWPRRVPTHEGGMVTHVILVDAQPHMSKRFAQSTALIHASAVTNVTTETNPQPGTPLAACSVCSKVTSLVLVDSRQR